MAVIVEHAAAPALWNLCRAIQSNIRPGSRAQNAFRKDVRTIAIEDHTDMMLTDVTRHGAPRAPLAEATLARPRRGDGPSLVPRRLASRYVTNFEAVWLDDPGQGVLFLVLRYVDILSKTGVSIVPFHERGATKPGTKWVLPARPTGGITPKGFARIRARFATLPDEIRRMGG